jgi:hypothetical protein
MKLTACETMEVALVGGNNLPKFNGYGAIRAGKSPAAAAVIEALDPMRCDGKFSQDANGDPYVKINYFLEQDIAPQTSFSCTPRAKATPSQTDFKITKYLQDGLNFNSKEYETLCCDVETYLNSQYSGISLQGNQEALAFMRKFSALGQFKQQFMTSLNSAFLQPMENYALTKLVPGYNPVDATSAQVPIVMKDATGRWTTELLEKIAALKLETGYCGQYIAIGGTKWSLWFGAECGMPNVTCCSDIGVNFQAVRDNLPFEFYYSRFIDQMYGDGALILIEEGSFALFNWLQKKFLPDAACCETYGSLTVSLASCCDPSMALPFDTHSTVQGLCATGGKGVDQAFFWSSKYDVWTKPFSFLYGTAPLSTMTGVFHFKWQ